MNAPTKWIIQDPDCHPVLRALIHQNFAGEIAYACSSCGKGSFESPGQVCEECQEPEGA